MPKDRRDKVKDFAEAYDDYISKLDDLRIAIPAMNIRFKQTVLDSVTDLNKRSWIALRLALIEIEKSE
jgi:hypothetical protein